MERIIILDDPREDEEPDMEVFNAWVKWFKENCGRWNDVDDIESELGRDKE